MHESTLAELESLFLALSDKTRLRLLALMADGEVPVGFLADRLGESQPKTSRHLAYLRTAGLVSSRRDGKWIYYGIAMPSDPAASAILKATISSIAAVRVDGEILYFAGSQPTLDNIEDEYDDIYAETNRSCREPDELDVFLL